MLLVLVHHSDGTVLWGAKEIRYISKEQVTPPMDSAELVFSDKLLKGGGNHMNHFFSQQASPSGRCLKY